MTAPSQINLYEATLPTAPLAGLQSLSIDTTTKALVKTDSNGNTIYLGATATPNVIGIGKSLGAGSSITSITVSSGVATVTQTAHGFSNNDWVAIAGATGAGVGDTNQLHQITVTGANTYTYITSATGTIGGTILAMFWFKGTRSINLALIKNVTRSGTGTYSFTFVNTQADIYYGFYGSGSSSTSGSAESLTGQNPATGSLGVQLTDNGNVARDATIVLQVYFLGIQ